MACNNRQTNIVILVIGLLIGFALCWFIFVKRNDVEAVKSTIQVDKHSGEVSEVTTIVKYDTKYVYLTNSVGTDYYGDMVTSTIIEREQFLYTHKINVQAMIFTSSAVLGVGYQHKNWQYNIYYGIGYNLATMYGVGVGYQFNIK